MPFTVSENGQTRVPNCYASSADVKLTLRVNGEETGAIITPLMAVVPAGINAPTVAPTCASGGAGNVPEGYYVYRYVYASSAYPFVENAVTGGGEQWPRSNPSPASSVFQVTGGAKKVNVTCACTTRSDIDWIWVYRTVGQTTSDLATAEDEAGILFYVGSVANNTDGGSVVFQDNSATDTGEKVELDNFECPLFRYTVYDGTYWWGFGNDTIAVVVDLNSTDTFTISAFSDVPTWFSGRDTTPTGFNLSEVPGPTNITFIGITTGGYDNRGTFYFKTASTTTGHAYNAPAITTPVAIPATGTTTAFLSAPGTTLYRSKPNNPFSWGWTPQVISNGQPIDVPQLWAEKIGGGTGTALSLIPNERILKLDTEAPTKSYALDLNAADQTTFLQTLRTLDEAQSVSSNFSQFAMRQANGATVGSAINAKANQIVAADAQSQIPIGNNVIRSLRKIEPEGTNADFFHGAFDYRSELNCWIVKTTDLDHLCDTLLFQHAPTSTWGLVFWPGITASGMIYDAATRQNMTFVGSDDGLLGRAFSPDVYRSWMNPVRTGTTMSYNGGTVVVQQPLLATITFSIRQGATALVITETDNDFAVGDLIAVGTSGAPGIYRVSSVSDTVTFEVDLPYFDDSGDPLGGLYIFEPSHFCWGVWYSSTRAYLTRITDLSIQLVTSDTVSSTATLAGAIDLQTGASVTPDSNVTPYDAYVGATPCLIRRYFTAKSPGTDKQNTEFWTTIVNVDGDVQKLYVAYYYAYQGTQAESVRGTLEQDTINADITAPVYFDKTPPSDLSRSFGYEAYECGYQSVQFMDFTIKASKA